MASALLKGLVDYEISSDEEDEMETDMTGSEGAPVEVASRSIPKPEESNGMDAPLMKKRTRLEENCEGKFKLPGTIQSMFDSNHQQQRQWMDNPEEHDQRVRSFPHVEGNWATHVYIPVPWDSRLFEFINACVEMLSPLPFHTMPELHMSLSRTVTIRHHWIESLVDSLRANLSCLNGCISDFSGVTLVPNDDKTRTFLCLELTMEDTNFLEYVTAVDKSLAEFRLPPYYDNPSFHVSVGWCLGDVTEKVGENKRNKLKEMFGDFIAANPDLSILNVKEVCCRTGNKYFVMPLKDSDR